MKAERKKVEFESVGYRLAGLLELPADSTRGTVIFAHCFTCGKDVLAASRLSKNLVAQGFSVLRFDFRGLGGSEGDFSETNFTTNVNDLVAAAAYLRTVDLVPSLLIGHSLGGRAVLSAAHQIPECDAVVTVGAPASPAHVAKQFAIDPDKLEGQDDLEVVLSGRNFTFKKQFFQDIARDNDDIEQLRIPLLVMHSPVDTTVSIAQAEEIYRRAMHPKSFVSLGNADHLLTNKADVNYVATIIASWSERYIGVENDSTPSSQKVA